MLWGALVQSPLALIGGEGVHIDYFNLDVSNLCTDANQLARLKNDWVVYPKHSKLSDLLATYAPHFCSKTFNISGIH